MVSGTSIRYAIRDSRDNQLLLLFNQDIEADANMPESLRQLVREEEELLAKYRKISLLIRTPAFALRPESLETKDTDAEFLEFLFGLPYPGARSEPLLQSGIKAIYHLPAELLGEIKSTFGPVEIRHSSAALLDHYFKLNSANGKSKVYAHLHQPFVELTLIKNGNLHYHNYFEFRSKEDLVYYILLLYEQWDLDREEIPLILSGDIMQDSSVYPLLYKYIASLQFARLPEALQCDEEYFGDLPLHRYVNLLSAFS